MSRQQADFEALLGGEQDTAIQGPATPVGADFESFLDQPTDTREELETGFLGTVMGGLDYVGSRARGLLRGAFGGDFTDRSSFSGEATDPNSALGFLVPGAGIIPEPKPMTDPVFAYPEWMGTGPRQATEFMKHVPSTVLGIGLDILTDPITYVTGGLGKGIQFGLKGAKVTLVSSRQLTRARRVAETVASPVTSTRPAQALAAGARRVYNTVDEAVISATTRTDDLGEIARAQRELDFRIASESRAVYQSRVETLRAQESLINKYGDDATSGDIMAIVTDAMEQKPSNPATFTHPLRDRILSDPDAQRIIDDLGPSYREMRQWELANDIDSPDFNMARERRIGDLTDQLDEMKARREGNLMQYRDRVAAESGRRIRYADGEIERLSGPAFRDLPENQGAIVQMNKMKLEAEDHLADIYTRVGERLQQNPAYMVRVEDRILQQQALRQLDPNYVLHTFTPEAKTLYQQLNRKTFGGFIRRRTFSESNASQLNRQLLDEAKKYPTIAEFNKAGRSGELAAFGKQKLDFDVFETDPLRLSIERQLRGIRTVENTRFLRDVSARYGETLDDIANRSGQSIDDLRTAVREGEKYGRITLADGTMYQQGKAQALGDRWFPPEIADHLDFYNKVSSDPRDINNVLSIFDSVTNYWKGKTLSLFPAYHSRNVVGNVWNNFLAGVTKPGRYDMARRIQNGEAGSIAGKSFDDIRAMIRKNGVENQGFFGTDIERSLNTAMADATPIWEQISNAKFRDWNPLSLDGTDVWSTTGRRAGTYLENNARIANFIDGLDNGLAPDDAAQRVFKYLFDYGDVTRFEKDTLLRMMPFYRWTRFNLPLQLEQLVKQPGKFAAIEHIKAGVEARQGNEPVEEALVSEYISENIGVQWRRYRDEEGRDRASFFLLGNWLPAADLDNLSGLSRVTEEAVAMLNPLIKTPLELFANYDTFRKQPIERIVDPQYDNATFLNPTGGEMGEFLGIPMRKKWEHLIRNVRLLYEIDRSNPYGVNNAVPWVREHVFGADLGNRETIPENQRGAWERWFRFLSGVRLTNMDVGTSRAIEGRMMENALTGYRGMLRDAIREGNASEEARLRNILDQLRRERGSIGGGSVDTGIGAGDAGLPIEGEQ